MFENPDIDLPLGSKIVLKKIKGDRIIEFSRHRDPVLDNMVEYWSYQAKKSTKNKSSWILLKDLHLFIDSYLETGQYEILEGETIIQKNTKKN
jgi:hypothetical protein